MQKVNYQNIRKYGRRVYTHRWLVLVAVPNYMHKSRYGWTVPRHVGSAVLRNKYKRWLREVLRKEEASKTITSKGSPVDLNFVFKKMEVNFYKNKTFLQFKQEIKKALKNVDKKIKK